MASPARHAEGHQAATERRGPSLTVSIARGGAHYPQSLAELSRPPRVLWTRGNMDVLARPVVAIVGTRKATPYGERITRELARTLARAGACVVSGLARGIDGVAHRGALEVSGATCAVLGTGVDVVYPKAHAALQEQIGREGLLLSELSPNDPAHRGSFPERNRIIAALASAVIVVEAGLGSGAIITADHALELGRTVAAVPGPIDVPQSAGSNRLLRDGAVPITSMADAITLMGLDAPRRADPVPQTQGEQRVLEALRQGAAPIDVLCHRSGLPAHEGMAAVSSLEMRGLIECELTGAIRRT